METVGGSVDCWWWRCEDNDGDRDEGRMMVSGASSDGGERGGVWGCRGVVVMRDDDERWWEDWWVRLKAVMMGGYGSRGWEDDQGADDDDGRGEDAWWRS